jgi:two-component system NtrC family sensor kinase
LEGKTILGRSSPLQPGGTQEEITLAAPIKVRDQIIGVLDAHKPAGAGGWSPQEIVLMETLINQLGAALESARLYRDTQSRAARERLTSEVTARIRETLDLETVLKTAVQEVRQAMGLPEVVIRLLPEADIQGGNGSERSGD